MKEKKACGMATEVYSRVVGYYRPIQNWNKGKREEFAHRKTFKLTEETVKTEKTISMRREESPLCPD